MNPDVTKLLDGLKHPFRKEIEELRAIIIGSRKDIDENIKWSGPNYSVNGQDRVSVKVQPAKSFQVIFHIGAKVKAEPKERLLAEDYNLLVWKSNDRAIMSFKDADGFIKARPYMKKLVANWFDVTL